MTGEELDRLLESLKVLPTGDIVTPDGKVVGHCDMSKITDNVVYGITIK